MEDNKPFAVYVNAILVSYITVYQSNTLGQLTDHIKRTYMVDNMATNSRKLMIYITNTTALSTDTMYSNMPMSTYWNYIESGAFIIGGIANKETEAKTGVKTQCVKVGALRKAYPRQDIDLEKWMSIENNLYCGRKGRIFIRQPDGSDKIFHYKDSKWCNPFNLKDYTVDESLRLYREHVLASNLKNELGELRGKTLGCFCDQSGKCHVKLLADLCTALP